MTVPSRSGGRRCDATGFSGTIQVRGSGSAQGFERRGARLRALGWAAGVTTVAAATAAPLLRRRRRRFPWFAVAAIAPAIAVVTVFTILPLLWAVRTSFERNNGIRSRWVGLENYQRLLESGEFRSILFNNVVFLLAVPGVLTLALVAAALIYERVPGYRAFRVLLFLPTIISTVVVGILFRAFFALDGPVNQAIKAFGGEPVNWLGEGNTAMTVIIIALVWGGLRLRDADPARRHVVDRPVAARGRGHGRRELVAARADDHAAADRAADPLRLGAERVVHVHVAVRLHLRDDLGRPGVRHDDARLLRLQPGLRRLPVRDGLGPRADPAGSSCSS